MGIEEKIDKEQEFGKLNKWQRNFTWSDWIPAYGLARDLYNLFKVANLANLNCPIPEKNKIIFSENVTFVFWGYYQILASPALAVLVSEAIEDYFTK